jgi:hypothetical protein
LAQEKLSHHLDDVEVSIAEQVAQKSHHFFQVRFVNFICISFLEVLAEIVALSCISSTFLISN